MPEERVVLRFGACDVLDLAIKKHRTGLLAPEGITTRIQNRAGRRENKIFATAARNCRFLFFSTAGRGGAELPGGHGAMTGNLHQLASGERG